MRSLLRNRLTAGRGLSLVALAAWTVLGCDTGAPKVEYEYVYREAAGGATAGGAAAAGRLPLTFDGVPKRGAPNPKVVIVEVSDFQWPFCARVGPTLERILTTWPDDVQLAFVHNPLPFHNRALEVAKAAVAAQLQGKFWPFHDLVFHERRFDEAALEDFARRVGLDVAQWKKDRESPEVLAKIKHDQAVAAALGARGTPSFFINGESLRGAQPFAAFQTAIEKALKEADEELAKGTKRSDLLRVLGVRHAGQAFADYLLDGKMPPGAGARAAPSRNAPSSHARRPPPGSERAHVEVHPDDAVRGNPKAPVTIVEFSDFQWPFCARVGPTLDQIEETYGDKVRIVFKHNPLSFHKFARTAAEAALAAKAQGKFWEYAHLLFQNQRALSRADLERYAQQLGLDMDKFRRDLDTHAHARQIERDLAEARKAGVRGTPTFVINDRLVRGALPFDAFKRIIDEELRGGAPDKGGAAPSPAGGTRAATGARPGASVAVPPMGPIMIGPARARHTVVLVLRPDERQVARLLHAVSRSVQRGGNLRASVVFKPMENARGASARIARASIAVAQAVGADKAWEFLKLASARARAADDAQLRDIAKRVGAPPEAIDKAASAKAVGEVLDRHADKTAPLAATTDPVVVVDGKAVASQGRWSPKSILEALRK